MVEAGVKKVKIDRRRSRARELFQDLILSRSVKRTPIIKLHKIVFLT